MQRRVSIIVPTLFLAALSACGDEAAGTTPSTAKTAEVRQESTAKPATGIEIYRKMCLSCHGAGGEGSKDHPETLVGDRTIEKLIPYISKSMPEDKPGTCKGDDAKKVAEYIYNAFYSRAAQARNKPPKIELARLTVGQYRNAVADLIATFADPAKPDERPGLKGEYANGKRPGRDKNVFERLDPIVNFAFDEKGPGDKVNAEEYSARWSGAVFAPESGEYEFNLESANGARLWVNDVDRPLIDAWVRSGDEKAHRETITLLAGRLYPIRLEFFKEKKEKAASIALKWKVPGRVEELIPERALTAGKPTGIVIVKTAFPPDDRSMGYERGNSVSRAWDEATTQAGLEVADYIVPHLKQLSGTSLDAPDAKKKLVAFCRRFVERAFRRPLTTAQQVEFFLDRHFADGDLEMAVKRVVLLALKSPRFLYREIGSEKPDAFDVASRISFGLWDSLPDAPLLEAAASGKLASPEQISQQVERMIPDLRTRAKIRMFFHQWLQMDRVHELTKDAKRFPEFNDAVVSDLRTSVNLFLDDVIWSDASDFRQLLLSDAVFLNGRLAKIYGADLPENAPFQKVTLDPARHVGILTHPLLMAGFAYDSTTSPIHRGLFVARSLLGRRLRPPPEAVVPLPPALHPDMTTRERVTLQTRAQSCQSCHSMINPLGFALENFDAVGRFRDTEGGKKIDASGSYWTRTGDVVKFNGPRELGESLIRNEETTSAFIEHLFHFLVKQPILAHGLDRPDVMREEFIKNNFNMRKLLVQAIAMSASIGSRTEKNPK
jgi:mono/diheme cytochrome c family protein